MKNLSTRTLDPFAIDGGASELLASRRHTLLFLVIWLVVTVCGGLSAALNAGANDAPGPNDMIPFYLFLIGMQLLWVRFVNKGMQRNGHSIFEFIGRTWFRPTQLASDVAYAALAFGLIYALTSVVTHFSHHDPQSANIVLPSLPSGAFGLSVWVSLSLTAGTCEEIMFRGYLQRQFAAMIGRPRLAILAQAILFAIGHIYEGLDAVVEILLIGLVLGALAAWRGNIRAGILVHAALDVLAGFGIA
jgi:membrane protease YdiL (CAAX protease family)